jgi:hypothetical protein
MVVENVTDAAINLSGIFGEQVMRSLDLFVKIGIGAGIAIIVYILYLLVKGFFQARRARDTRKILRVLERIDDKMDVLVSSKQKKKRK